MVTGRDLIIYILRHGLEDEPVFEDGKFAGFLTEGEYAAIKDVGISTVRTLADMGLVDSVHVKEGNYIWDKDTK